MLLSLVTCSHLNLYAQAQDPSKLTRIPSKGHGRRGKISCLKMCYADEDAEADGLHCLDVFETKAEGEPVSCLALIVKHVCEARGP